jgi:hypothetical protein
MARLLLAAGAIAAALWSRAGASERFPTEDHKKFPLARITEYAQGAEKVTFVPYKEPDFARGWRELGAEFSRLKFPLAQEAGDTVRYFTGISHPHFAFPRGHNEVSAASVGSAYLHKIVFGANGRPKSVYGVKADRSEALTLCVVYYDERRTTIMGRFHRDKLGSLVLCEWPAGGDAWDLTRPPSRRVSQGRPGQINSWEELDGGKRVRLVRPPLPEPLEAGKWPCQAARYAHELKQVVSAQGLTDAERAKAILKYTKCEAEANEETWRGGSGYSGLRAAAVASLGRLKCREAHEALLELLKGRSLRAAAATALGEQAQPADLPFLLNALEQEDSEARQRGFTMADKRRHLVTASIAELMLQISPDRAKELLGEFLRAKERAFRSVIERAMAQ